MNTINKRDKINPREKSETQGASIMNTINKRHKIHPLLVASFLFFVCTLLYFIHDRYFSGDLL
jgi:hypothetical protein